MDDELVSWDELIQYHKEEVGDKSEEVYCSLDDVARNSKFNNDYGSTNGEPFTLWTVERVYFPTEYDGSEGVASAPRNPCDEVMNHVS